MLTVGDSFPQFSCQACVGTGKDDMKVLTSRLWPTSPERRAAFTTW